MGTPDSSGADKRGLSGLGTSGAVADAAASAEALCRALDSAKLSNMAADLRATGGGGAGGGKPHSSGPGPVMLKADTGKKVRNQEDDSTHSSALLQEQEEEERRLLTGMSPQVAEFDMSNLRGIKAPDEDKAKRKHKDRHGGGHGHHHGHGDEQQQQQHHAAGGGYGHHDTNGHGRANPGHDGGHHGHGHHGGGHNSNGGNNGMGLANMTSVANMVPPNADPDEGDADLANLAELVPGLRSRAGTLEEAAGLGQPSLPGHAEEMDGQDEVDDPGAGGGNTAKRPAEALNAHQAYGQRQGDSKMGGRWSTEVNALDMKVAGAKGAAAAGTSGSPKRQPQQVDNLDSMQVGRSDDDDADDDVANALAAGAAAGLAGVVAADKHDDSDSNESLVTRDEAEPMPGNEGGVPDYGDLTGFDGGNNSNNAGGNNNTKKNDASSRSSSSGSSDSDDNNANTSESVPERKGGRRSRKSRDKGNKKGNAAPAAPELSSDEGHGQHRYGHSHEDSMEPRLPPAPEPGLHEYGGAAAGAAGAAAAAAATSSRAGRPMPHSSQSVASLSTQTATQTHEVRMPMYLPTFKPATGCTNASDFIVRCFVARLRSGITVVKHGRSRWCKSRLRILHVHSDGRSLTWKPALGEPSSSKRPPKLDLSTCQEVRHAWSPDPLNPMFTGTPILRQKCEAANAHKSFALVFPKRTVDITAVTADQCKVLMEGFSALCFRLQVANLAGRGTNAAGGAAAAGSEAGKKGAKSDQSEEDRTTASVTLTNTSRADLSPTARGGAAGGGGLRASGSGGQQQR